MYLQVDTNNFCDLVHPRLDYLALFFCHDMVPDSPEHGVTQNDSFQEVGEQVQ